MKLVSFFIACGLAACSSSSTPNDAGSDVAVVLGNIGDPCPNGSADCQAGLQCAGEDPGGGQCFKPCTPEVDTDCGDTTKYACSFEGHCYVRCTQTVAPLGLAVEPDERLAEGADPDDTRALLLQADGAVACTHGDVIENIVGLSIKKGAAVVLDGLDVVERIDAP